MTDNPERMLDDGSVRGVQPDAHERQPELVGRGRWRTRKAPETVADTTIPTLEPDKHAILMEQILRPLGDVANEQTGNLDEQQPNE